MRRAVALLLALALAACSPAKRSTTPMTTDDEAMVRALTSLSAVLASKAPKREAAAALRDDLDASGPAWLPEGDLRYYRALAELRAGQADKAEVTLAGVPDDSVVAPEAQWTRAKLISARMTDDNAASLRPLLLQARARVAALRPRSAMTQYVADAETDARERAAPGAVGPRAVPVVKVGRRFDWQKLVSIGDLYQKQKMHAEAAEAYGWSLEVRYPDEWLQAVAAGTWERVADCHERRGDRALSLRYLAKALALPVDANARARLAATLTDRAKAAPPAPEAPRPDRGSLAGIAASLAEMELFDEAIAAYRRAAALGEDTALAEAETLEQRARFLLDYRRERSALTVLFGAPLGWDRVTAAFEEAKRAFGPATGAKAEAGRARCDEAIREIEGRAEAEGAR